MTDHPVTLAYLEELDAELARVEAYIDQLFAELVGARQGLEVLRARQARACAEYNAQAARPLAEWDGRGVIRRRPS